MATSFLTLGGWEKDDYEGPITWFRTGGNWDQVLTEFKVDGSTIVTEMDQTTVTFATGYPYIGLSSNYFEKVADILTRKYQNM